MKVLMTVDTLGDVLQYAIELAEGLSTFGDEILLAITGTKPRRELPVLARGDASEPNYKVVWMDEACCDLTSRGEWLRVLERTWKPDIVHLNDLTVGDQAWSVPAVAVGHSCVWDWWAAVHKKTPSASWNPYRDMVVRSLRAVDAVVAGTRRTLAELEAIAGPFGRSRVINNGRRMPRLPVATKEAFILTHGPAADPAKNMDSLSGVASRLPWPIYVCGESDEASIGGTSFGSRLFPLGWLSPEASASWFSRASLFVLPAYYEATGMSILEAASSGCALVLGDIPSLREVWRDAALFVDPDDRTALHAAVLGLIKDQNLRIEYATRARTRAGRFGADKMAAEYRHFYLQLIADRPGRRGSNVVPSWGAM